MINTTIKAWVLSLSSEASIITLTQTFLAHYFMFFTHTSEQDQKSSDAIDKLKI